MSRGRLGEWGAVTGVVAGLGAETGGKTMTGGGPRGPEHLCALQGRERERCTGGRGENGSWCLLTFSYSIRICDVQRTVIQKHNGDRKGGKDVRAVSTLIERWRGHVWINDV